MMLRPLSLAVLLALPAALPSPAASAATVASVAQSPSQQLEQLFAEHWEQSLQRSPLRATFIGDPRYNDQLPNSLSPQFREESIAFANKWLARYKSTDPATLDPQTRLSYEIMVRSLELELEGYRFRSDLMPLNQFYNLAGQMAELGSGKSAQPFATVKDYDDWLARAGKLPVLLAQVQANMAEGVKIGMVQPKVLIAKVLPQLDALIRDKPEDTLFWQPIANLPATFPDADKARLTEAYRKLIAEQLMPAYRQLRRYVNDEYLARGRDSVGMAALPDGKAMYAYRVRVSTTTDMTPVQLHEIGLSEVARIHAEMHGVMTEVGFKGSLQDFFKFMTTDKRFEFASEQALLDAYNALRVKVDAGVPRLFAVTPKAQFEIRPTEAFRAASAAGGDYQRPGKNGSRPGVFSVNTHDLPTRKTWDMEDLYLHEAIPGHHFQLAIQQELEGIPAFRQFGSESAFSEGWGLYAESLGKELGVYTDPYMYFGKLQGELWRAIRLVVDTGLHDRDWTRAKVIEYMMANSAVPESEAVSEAERYMAIPGQALSYKVGQMKIRELRTRAEAALGDRFDVREFHDQVIKDGSLPLSVLEAKIDRWIAARKA